MNYPWSLCFDCGISGPFSRPLYLPFSTWVFPETVEYLNLSSTITMPLFFYPNHILSCCPVLSLSGYFCELDYLFTCVLDCSHQHISSTDARSLPCSHCTLSTGKKHHQKYSKGSKDIWEYINLSLFPPNFLDSSTSAIGITPVKKWVTEHTGCGGACF